MTNKKAQNATKAQNYRTQKIEVANELGFTNNTEVNAKMASEHEAKYSKKTMNRKSHIANGNDYNSHEYSGGYYTGRKNI